MLDSILLNEQKEIKKNTNTKKKQKEITYCIKPLQYYQYDVEQWIVLLEQLKNLKKDILFVMEGNKYNFLLYITIPLEDKQFFETMFWSAYDFVQLIPQQDKIFPKPRNYAHFSNDTIIKSQKDFDTKKTSDPFKDMFNIFQSIDTDSKLTFIYNISQSKQSSRWKKSSWKQFFKKRHTIKPYYLNIGYTIKSENTNLQISCKNTIIGLLQRFCKQGKVSIHNYPFSLSLDENQLSPFFHLPTWNTPIKGFKTTSYKSLPSPGCPQINDSLNLGTSIWRNETQNICITQEQITKHLYILGKTGTGKSTFMSNLILQDIEKNNGLCLVDPHGDLVEQILQHIPSNRINDVIIFDISDTEYPLGFNLLERNTEEEKNLIVSGLISVFYKIFGHSRGPRMEYILRNVLYTIIEYPQATLLHVIKILTDKGFRKEVLSYVKDDIIKSFRHNEFEKRSDRQIQEVISPLTNKIGQFLSSSQIRNIIGQPHSGFNLFEAMQTNKIILLNLSKGKVGEDTATLIGSMFITKMQIETMKRASLVSEQRKPFHLYIDEFQNFSTESFATILSESRKYQLGLIIANQYISQLNDKVKQAIFGNVGTTIVFGLGHQDAEYLSKEYKGLVTTQDFQSLPNYQAYVKLSTKNGISEPFHIFTHDIQKNNKTDNTEVIIGQSRERYCIERKEIEKMLAIKIEKKGETNQIKSDKVIRNKLFENSSEQPSKPLPESLSDSSDLSVKSLDPEIINIELGNPYLGTIKLKYNYGLFIVVGNQEGLLHKNDIVTENNIKGKKFYKEGDKITVIAKEFKEINGEKKVVWTQKID